jgi:beta-N-acetylhexosaminidase
VGFRGLCAQEGDPIVRDIEEYGVGSVVLFDFDVLLKERGRNIESLSQVKRLVASLQARAGGQLFVCVDQEGGQVCRMKEALGFPALPSAQSLGELDDVAETERLARRTADALAELGVNFNLAPTVDVNLRPENPVIGGKERSFSADNEVVVRHARAFISGHSGAHVLCALKHFPGHGSSMADSHLGEGAVDAIMTAHVFHRGLDPAYPATLSEPIIGGLLRRDLAFDGVVVSDDMQMGAIANHYGLEEALRAAIVAGVDIITLANNTLYECDIVPRAVQSIVQLVERGEISRERIATSCRRIAQLRARLVARS